MYVVGRVVCVARAGTVTHIDKVSADLPRCLWLQDGTPRYANTSTCRNAQVIHFQPHPKSLCAFWGGHWCEWEGHHVNVSMVTPGSQGAVPETLLYHYQAEECRGGTDT